MTSLQLVSVSPGVRNISGRRPATNTVGAPAITPTINPVARAWLTLAVGSLVVAGLLSLAVVVGRLPVLSRIIDDPLFFKRCLVVHVDLALVVWFYAFIAGLLALNRRTTGSLAETLGFCFSAAGVMAMLAGGLVRGAPPILANYVPVIDHPLFGAGLAAFGAGALLTFLHALAAPGESSLVPPEAEAGLRAAALLVVVAGATWISACAGLPSGVDAYTRAEFLAWGPGHVLQAANTAAMLGVWLWLLRRATGAPVLSRRAAAWIFSALVIPQCTMPLLTARGTLDTLYHSGATLLMRWTIFPAVLLMLMLGVRQLWRHRAHGQRPSLEGRMAFAGFTGSAGLASLGMILGACIRSSTTLVPAHYHASLGAVTMAFMTAAYVVAATARTPSSVPESLWRAGRFQLGLFGVGQSVFALGFAIGGAYGLGRKAYAAEQHVRSTGEVVGLVVMGVGGLVAVAGGLWFLFLILREIHRWWARRSPVRAGALFQPS